MTNPEHEPMEQGSEQSLEFAPIEPIEAPATPEQPQPRGVTVFSDQPQLAESMTATLEQAGIADGIVVIAEMRTEQSRDRSQMGGLDLALEQTADGRPMVVLSFQDPCGPNCLCDPRTHALRGHPHVELLQLPAGPAEIAEALSRAERRERPADELAVELLGIHETSNRLASIQHAYQKIDPTDQERVAPFLEQIRALGFESNDADIQRILDSSLAETRPFAGRSLPGLFVDIEGTLIGPDGTVNERVVQLLHEQSARMPITIWTGGDTTAYREQLARLGLPWKVTSKLLFQDAEVECALDDLPQDRLERQYNVRAKNYLNVNELF